MLQFTISRFSRSSDVRLFDQVNNISPFFLNYNSFYAVSNLLMVVDRLVKKSRTQDKMVMKLERSNKAKDIENER